MIIRELQINEMSVIGRTSHQIIASTNRQVVKTKNHSSKKSSARILIICCFNDSMICCFDASLFQSFQCFDDFLKRIMNEFMQPIIERFQDQIIESLKDKIIERQQKKANCHYFKSWDFSNSNHKINSVKKSRFKLPRSSTTTCTKCFRRESRVNAQFVNFTFLTIRYWQTQTTTVSWRSTTLFIMQSPMFLIQSLFI